VSAILVFGAIYIASLVLVSTGVLHQPSRLHLVEFGLMLALSIGALFLLVRIWRRVVPRRAVSPEEPRT
jgi:hypothetical protein